MGVRTPEGKVKDKIKAWLDRNLPGYWMYSPPGGVFGKAGTSDRFVLWRGVFCAIEVKREGKELTRLQEHRCREVLKRGGIAVAMLGYEEWKLERLKELILERGWVGDDGEIRRLPVADQGGGQTVPAPEGDGAVPRL